MHRAECRRFRIRAPAKTDRSGVCGNHQIESDCARAQPARSVEAMPGHRTAYPLSRRTRRAEYTHVLREIGTQNWSNEVAVRFPR